MATLLDALHPETIRRSSLWRIRPAVDLQPHTREYWWQSHDADFDAQAHTIDQLYAQALAFYQPGRLGMCCEEQTGV